MAIMISGTRFVSGLNPPLIESPISEGVLRSIGLLEFTSGGFPVFDNNNIGVFMNGLVSELQSKSSQISLTDN